MLFYLFLLFIVLPMVELSLLLALADATTWQLTLGLVLVTGFVGAALARWQGWRTYANIQRELAAGRMPTDALMDAGMILVASAFLLTPGIITDLFGFSLLIPACRILYRRLLKRTFQHRVHIQTGSTFHTTENHYSPQDPDVIDSYVVKRQED